MREPQFPGCSLSTNRGIKCGRPGMRRSMARTQAHICLSSYKPRKASERMSNQKFPANFPSCVGDRESEKEWHGALMLPPRARKERKDLSTNYSQGVLRIPIYSVIKLRLHFTRVVKADGGSEFYSSNTRCT
ncbi:hypothetical protein CBL_03141 [Carabus blaptoides fortunei]